MLWSFHTFIQNTDYWSRNDQNMTFSIKDLVIFKVVEKNKILSLNQRKAQFSFLECVLESADCSVMGEHADSRSDHKSVFWGRLWFNDIFCHLKNIIKNDSPLYLYSTFIWIPKVDLSICTNPSRSSQSVDSVKTLSTSIDKGLLTILLMIGMWSL